MSKEAIKKYAIVVAGGAGSRMKSAVAKQFIVLQGKPVLFHTLENLYHYDPSMAIVLVLPEAHINYWKELIVNTNFSVPHTIAVGGTSRFKSVKSGLDKIESQNGVVAIHDGVRPFVHHQSIEDSFQSALQYGSGVTAVPLKDSIRENTGDRQQTVARKRTNYHLVQTPQTFDLEKIKKAFCIDEQATFTDDASVFEQHGYEIKLTKGSYDNIKITTPEDLLFANAIIKGQKEKT